MRAATDGTSSDSPNTSRTTTASVRTPPSGRPTPSISDARATMASVWVIVSPRITPRGRLRPPVPAEASSPGSTGSTQGVRAVPAPATTANRISNVICSHHSPQSLRSDDNRLG